MGELSRRLDALSAENARLASKVLERDAFGAAREQALAEAMRTADEANAGAAKAKTDAAAAQAEAAAARAKLSQVEREDVEFLRALVDALTEAVGAPKGKEP
jgi:DNA recombination protein RmuC